MKKSGNSYSRFYIRNSEVGLDNKSGDYRRAATVKGIIYVDKSSLEIYIDDSIAISGTKYLTGKGLEVFADGNVEWSVTVTEMKSIHNES